MGFSQYRVTRGASAFERYYDIFLQNSFAQKSFRIRSVGGEELIGIPMASSIINPSDPNAGFHFRSADGVAYFIPFRELEDAQPLDRVATERE